jgi:hypothetical protein
LLQIISLIAGSTPSCKRGDVLNLKPSDLEVHWKSAAAGLDAGLRILKEDCGVIVPRWLPYYTLLIPLGAALAKRPMPAGPQAALARGKLVRWFWCSVFGQAYENAPNSQAAKDLGELIDWLDGGDAPTSVREFKFDPRILADTTPRQRALYRGTICLVLRNGARDFHSNQLISGDLIIEKSIDDHHIFPDDYLKTHVAGASQRSRDCVLNRTLIDRATNIRISNRAPSEYMSEIRDALGANVFGQLLTSHFVPHDGQGPLWSNDLAVFLAQRQSLLWEQIRTLTGLTEASDLIEEAQAA